MNLLLAVITGTDTNVGKTHVTRALLRALHRAGTPVAPLKLIETGCIRTGDTLCPADGQLLAAAINRPDALAVISPERFELPAAPATAARRVGRILAFESLLAHIENARALAPRVVLEGAGGFLVPIGPEGTFADLCTRFSAGVLVVARDALGTINHTLLTVEAIQRRGIPVVGVVLNATGPVPSALDHRGEIQQHLGSVPLYGPLPWLPDATNDTLADALAHAGLDPAQILRTFGWD